MRKEVLFGKTLNELIAVTKSAGLPGYSAKQIADWLYKKEISTINEMTNLSKKMREILANDYALGLSDPVNVAVSSDGTRKYLYNVLNDKYIETAYIPDNNRATIMMSLPEDYPVSINACYYAQGILAAIPTVWGLPPAEVIETQCMCKSARKNSMKITGHSSRTCIYDVRWEQIQPWHSRIRNKIPIIVVVRCV